MFITNAVVIALTAFLVITGPPEVPLYYGQPWGESQLATKWELILLPIFLNLTYYLTARFVNGPFKEEPVFNKIAYGISVIQSLLILLILIKASITLSP